jgi:hypothetical protein
VIARQTMSPDAWGVEFRLTVAGAYRWLPFVRRILRRLRGAQRDAAPVDAPAERLSRRAA